MKGDFRSFHMTPNTSIYIGEVSHFGTCNFLNLPYLVHASKPVVRGSLILRMQPPPVLPFHVCRDNISGPLTHRTCGISIALRPEEGGPERRYQPHFPIFFRNHPISRRGGRHRLGCVLVSCDQRPNPSVISSERAV